MWPNRATPAEASSGKQGGAQGLAGGKGNLLGAEHDGGFCAKPALVWHHRKMHIVPEVSGAVLPRLALKGEAGVQPIANAPLHGRRAGIPPRGMETAYCTGRGIRAGHARTNCRRTCPAHAAFGGCKPSGMVRANHKIMLDHRSQTKQLRLSHRRGSSVIAAALALKLQRGSARSPDCRRSCAANIFAIRPPLIRFRLQVSVRPPIRWVHARGS